MEFIYGINGWKDYFHPRAGPRTNSTPLLTGQKAKCHILLHFFWGGGGWGGFRGYCKSTKFGVFSIGTKIKWDYIGKNLLLSQKKN